MTVHLPQLRLEGSRRKYSPRLEIVAEVVAGLLWMQLVLPRDVEYQEIMDFARELVAQIHTGASEAMVERRLTGLQHDGLFSRADPQVIRRLARRAMQAVTGGP